MKIIDRKTEDHSNIFLVELDASEEAVFSDMAYNKLVKKMRIDGFRKGKAPKNIVEKAVGGRAYLLEEVLDEISAYKRMEFSQLEEFKSSTEIIVNVVELDPALKLEVYCPLPSEVKIGDYRSVRVPEVKSEFSEAKVDEALLDLRRDKADYGITERTIVEEYDLAIFDVSGVSGDSLLLNQKDAQYIVRHGSPYPMRGFADALIGMQVGKEAKISLEIPADFPRAELAGQKADFTVNIKEIKEQLLPELNDEFAQSFGPDFATLQDLRERIHNNLSRSYGKNAQTIWDKALMDAVLEKADIKYSGALVSEEIGRMMSEDMMRIRNQSSSSADFTRKLENYDKDAMREKYEPIAKDAILRSLYLQQLIKEENIIVSDEELDREINTALESIADKEEKEARTNDAQAPEYREQLRSVLLSQKAINLLREIAVSEPIVPVKKTTVRKTAAKKTKDEAAEK